jgi:hypothetical protein
LNRSLNTPLPGLFFHYVNEGYYHKRKSFVRKRKFGQNGHAKALVMRQFCLRRLLLM